MKEKEKIILESAIKLFAAKGFASTSIQEIATESGISKGAFYLYFKSKDKLLQSILEYYFNDLQSRIHAFDQKNLPPRKKFILQLTTMLETLVNHKEFIIMHSREQAIPLNEEVKKLFLKMHMEIHFFYQQSLSAIYGERVQPHIWDLSFILEGLFQSYIKIIFFDRDSFQIAQLPLYIMRRMDSIVAGIIDDEPFLTESKIESVLTKSKSFFFMCDDNIHTVVSQMKAEIAKLEDKVDLEVSMEVLESEINAENPRVPVIQGMLSNFKDFQVLKVFRDKIAAYYGIKL